MGEAENEQVLVDVRETVTSQFSLYLLWFQVHFRKSVWMVKSATEWVKMVKLFKLIS